MMKEKKDERHAIILQKVKKDRRISMVDLADILNVSEHTIRRDLKELSETGLLTAIRGGATVKSSMPFNIFERNKIDIDEKNIIAEKAIKLLENDQVIFFDGGTTTQAIAGHIPDHLKLTIVTHSFPVANILSTHPNIKLIFIGGELCNSSLTTKGAQTIQSYRQIYADLCFLGVCSIDYKKGLTARTNEEAEIKRVMCNQSNILVAATTSNKMNSAEPFFVTTSDNINFLITEKNPESIDFFNYSQQNIQLI